MQQDCVEIKNLRQLKDLVSHTLCQKNDFEDGVYQITEEILTKYGRLCGVFYCLHGPRSVKLTAVWDSEHNSILFYGSTGERFHKMQLASSVELAS